MKNTIKFLGLLMVASAIMLSCNRKNNKQTQTDATGTTPATEVHPATDPARKPYQVAGFQKTPCFGKCPSYQVKFFSDGQVTWYGRLNVERMGDYVATVSPDVLKSIRSKADETKYWDLQREYPIERRVADLPSTITYIRVGDVEKTVTNTHDAPQALKDFEKYLEDLITGLDWKPAEKK